MQAGAAIDVFGRVFPVAFECYHGRVKIMLTAATLPRVAWRGVLSLGP
jgi:hypothetical protein